MDWQLMGALPWYLTPEGLLYLLQGALGLGFVIFVHEMGHFLAAKACGVKCEKFYVGFDIPIRIGPLRLPRSLVRFKWGETEYGIGILPLGGYVKMLGQDDDPRNAAAEAERIRAAQGEANGAAGTAGKTEVADSGPAKDGNQVFQLDPRSYPAKSVPQRMLIISAGVIMNLIFAVIFAAMAYRQGLPYLPCEVGAVVAGFPAAQAGVRPGDRVLQIGRKGSPSEHLRYDWDLVQGIGMNGADQDMELLVRHRDGREDWVKLRPKLVTQDGLERPTIGVKGAVALKLNSKMPVIDYLPAGKSGLQGGDEIVQVDGQDVPDHATFQKLMWQRVDKQVKLRVRRSSPDKPEAEAQMVDVTVEPNRWKTLGLVMKAGPVEVVEPYSPAALAGIQHGDVIETVAGQPLGDPVTLPLRLRASFGQPIEVGVARPKGKDDVDKLTVQITPRIPESPSSLEEPGDSGLLAIDALGIAYTIRPEVAEVVSDSPAAAAGLQPGDRIKTVQFRVEPSDAEKAAETFGKNFDEPLVMDDSREHWLAVESSVQLLLPSMQVRIEYARGDKSATADLKPVESSEFAPLRGFVFTPKKEMRVAESWGEAIALGARKTKEDAGHVVRTISGLGTGRISVKNLGGPLSIGLMAASEASRGKANLLMFLTFLSANLAVLNFLPIPALDGGHMVFLAWEGIFRKPVNERVQVALTMFGVLCLLSLMVLVFGLDFWRLAR